MVFSSAQAMTVTRWASTQTPMSSNFHQWLMAAANPMTAGIAQARSNGYRDRQRQHVARRRANDH
jgi:hypothetical protein